MKEQISDIAKALGQADHDDRHQKRKIFKLPFKAKLSKMSLRKGMVTVVLINENNAVDFTRVPIIDNTVRLFDTYHAVDSEDILSYKGKPLIILPKKSKNPYNPNRVRNETYGQKHIMSRMMNETIKLGKKMGMGITIGAVILGGAAIYGLTAG